MKKLFMLVLIALISVSCSTIEEGTSKWKTPEAPNAGLQEGEKSHYLLDKKEEPVEVKPVVKPATKKITKKKKTK